LETSPSNLSTGIGAVIFGSVQKKRRKEVQSSKFKIQGKLKNSRLNQAPVPTIEGFAAGPFGAWSLALGASLDL
jgi:hypothetical protein